MEVLIVLAFCMTFLAVPARTFLPVFAQATFSIAARRRYALFLSLSGAGLDRRSAHGGRARAMCGTRDESR